MVPGSNDRPPSIPRQLVAEWRLQPDAFRLYLGLIAIITCLSFLSLPFYHWTGHSLWEAQLWSPPTDNFGDFWHYKKLFVYLHTAAFFNSADRFAYPAPCAIFYALLYHSGTHPHFVFDLIFVAIEVFSAFVFYQVLVRLGWSRLLAGLVAAFLLLTSYPWHTLYDRANLELFVYVFIAGGVWAYLTGRKNLAAVLWGCAGAMKIYPIVMLAVFLRRKTLRPLLIGIVTLVVVLVGSFWYVGPTIKIAALGSLNGVFGFLGNYAASARKTELNLDHSILGAIKEMLSLHRFGLGESWPNLSKIYQGVVIVFGPILYFARIRKLPALNQLCLFLIAVVLLPPVSYDYTLIHTYPVMGIVLGAYMFDLARGEEFPAARVYFTAFALLASAQTWIQFRGLRMNGIIKCLALLVICTLLLRFPLRMVLGEERAEAA